MLMKRLGSLRCEGENALPRSGHSFQGPYFRILVRFNSVGNAAEAGFLVTLHIIMVPVDLTGSAECASVCVAGDMQMPEDKIREGDGRLWKYVAGAIQFADAANVFDNSSVRHPFRLCARFEVGALVGSPDWPAWVPDTLSKLGE